MNKKLTKEQIEKRKQIKNKLMRIVNVICYVCTILLIVIAISTVLQSCKNSKNYKQNLKTENLTALKVKRANKGFDLSIYKYLYESSYSGSNVLTTSQIQTINSQYNVSNDVSYVARSNIEKRVDLDGYIYNSSGNVKHIVQVAYGFDDLLVSGTTNPTQYYYRLSYISFVDEQRDWYFYLNKNSVNAVDYNYTFGIGFSFYLSSYVIDDYLFSFCFHVSNIDGYQVFQFRNSLNYYYWANSQNYDKSNIRDLNVDIIYNSEFLNQDEYIIRLQLPKFISNGKVYDEIQLHYTSLEFWDGSTHLVPWQLSDGSGKGINVTAGYGFLWEINYVRYDGGQSYIYADSVYRRQEVSSVNNSNNNIDWAFTNDCFWVNQGYRQIIFIQEVNEFDPNYQQLISLNSYNSLTDYSGGILDVFTLLGTAFTSITSVLGIAVIPGFTIGMLLCLPLAVSLIIIIVKLVKK